MNKMVTKVFAVTTGAVMFAGMFAAGVGAPAKQADAANNIGTASSFVNPMVPAYDNGTNVQVFKTSYGYGAYATDSNGNVIGDEPIARTAYYIPFLETKFDTPYGQPVAALEVTVNPVSSIYGFGSGVTTQTYYDVADFAYNITDSYEHFANGLPVWQNAWTTSASLDEKGGALTNYMFEFDFGDYNDKYVEFAGTTFSLKDKYVDNTAVGVWTGTKWPDFGDFLGATEVYANPVFEDGFSLIDNAIIRESDILIDPNVNWPFGYAGQVIPEADGDIPDWAYLADPNWFAE